MPLIPPALDDRSYDDLVQDLLASIPAHTPEWTNPQIGDPGRSLIELFAWLADTILYRANLIPEKQRIAFLKLLGQPMQPAAPARGIVSLSLDSSSTTVSSLLASAAVPGPVTFESLGEIDLVPLTGQVYVKLPLTTDQQAQQMPLLTGLQKLYRLKKIPAGYTTTPLFADGKASAAPIDVISGTTDQSLWIALLAGDAKNKDKILSALGKATTRQFLLNVGVIPGLSLPDPFADIGPRAAVKALWQMTDNTSGTQPPIYNTLKVSSDTTQGLTRPGVVRLVLPPSDHIGAPSNDVLTDAQAGVGLKPPRIDDPDLQNKLITWLRLSATSAFQISWAGINALEIDQRTTYNFVPAGISDGSADQQFALSQTQIDPASFVLEVDMPGLGFQAWQQIDDLAVIQGPLQRYVLDPEAGTIRFGNQMQGLIPPPGRRIRVRRMRAGGGSAGNVPVGSLTTIKALDSSGTPVAQKITQPVATSGGAGAETLEQAERRLPSRLKHQERAVTSDDYKSLTLEVPGANVARAEVLPLFKPQTRTINVPGVVSVMVIPGKPGVQPPCPRADRPLLETVYQYLDSRRPATAEMYVIGSEYVGLGIGVAVEVRTGFGLLEVSQAVETALRNYLWPVAPGGSDGQGWPLGRRVRSLELEVIASRVPGVIEVNGLNLFTPLPTGGYQLIGSELDLQSWQLPEVLEITVASGDDGSGIETPAQLQPQPPPDPTIAVPVVPKVC